MRNLGVIICFLAGNISGFAADWPQWRGPRRDGISPETGLLRAWPAAGPRLVWKTQGLGEGYSTVSVVRGRIYTQGQRGEQQFVLAFDAATGKKQWETPNGRAYRESRGNGPRGVPTVDGERLYALAADGSLVCLDAATGKPLWSMNIVERFLGAVPNWGMSESPLVDGARLIVTPGGSKAAIVALDKSSGKPLWQSQSDEAGYSSVVAFDLGGKRQLAALTAEGAVGLDAGDGKLLWRYDKIANRVANIATPIVHNGHVFVSTDYGTGGALLKLTPQGASEVYFSREMKNHYGSSVLVGDYLYGYNSSILTAMQFATGEVAWRDRSVGKGSLIYAEGHLYCLGEGGVIGLVEATPTAYKEKSRFQIPRGSYPSWAPLVIADGRLYVREQDSLYCYDIKGS